MSDHVFTRCPGCRTVFRVTSAQLALRDGQVRCGQCRAVFDANDHVVKSAHPESESDAHVASPATVDDPAPAPIDRPTHVRVDVSAQPSVGEPAQSTTDAPDEAPVQEPVPEPVGEPAGKPIDEPADKPIGEPTDEPGGDPAVSLPLSGARDRSRQFEWRPRHRLREQPKALFVLAAVVLVALLGAQVLFGYRDALAAHAPFTRPVLDAACRVVGCTVAPLRDAAALSIEASDLQADPAHKGLLKLTATVRNRASYPIAYPYLELTLTDASDAIVARRAFAPSAYAQAAPATGIAGNGEVLVTMFFDASGTSQAGYRLYLFYR